MNTSANPLNARWRLTPKSSSPRDDSLASSLVHRLSDHALLAPISLGGPEEWFRHLAGCLLAHVRRTANTFNRACLADLFARLATCQAVNATRTVLRTWHQAPSQRHAAGFADWSDLDREDLALAAGKTGLGATCYLGPPTTVSAGATPGAKPDLPAATARCAHIKIQPIRAPLR
jgi:hypothetical protein